MKDNYTSILFGLFGAALVITALVLNVPDARFTQVLGIAGSFVAGAAGLAQANTNKD